MGCGALARRTAKTNVEQCAGTISGPEVSEEEFFRNDDDEAASGVGSLSPTPSVHSAPSSLMSSIPSLQSAARYSIYKGSSFSDDLRSDVPTIAESIADMQDFADLQVSNRNYTSDGDSVGHGAQCTPRGSKDASTGYSIDARMHPLGVMSDKTDSQSCMAAVGDLGGCSDVPSVRDDQSVTSAPSEICVSFPPSLVGSDSGQQFGLRHSEGTSTPTRKRMHGSFSNLGRFGGSRRASTGSPSPAQRCEEGLLNAIAAAASKNGAAKPLAMTRQATPEVASKKFSSQT